MSSIAKVPLTVAGAEALKAELHRLKTVERPAVIIAISEARAQGDLSENAEYDAAKNRQDFVRSRIAQIEGRIRELSMYTVASIPQGVVAYGSQVRVADVDADDAAEIAWEIVFPEEVDAAKGCISLSSPIGRALMNKTVGDEVEVHTPSGKRSYQILSLRTFHERQAKAE